MGCRRENLKTWTAERRATRRAFRSEDKQGEIGDVRGEGAVQHLVCKTFRAHL